jgi:signal recognition particle receptor subunit beta
MALVNQTKREINAKLVFFGPGLSGKSTNLRHVHTKLKPEFRGAMKAMSVQQARMLFFDFTPPGDGNVHGYRVRFHVYTVSGETVDPAAWKMVLKGVDGVVFVADASQERSASNRESLDSLDLYLKGYGQSIATVPVVFQYNKCDLPDALPVEDLERMLNPSRFPSFKASSQSGDGVLQTLLSLVKTVLTELRQKGVEGVHSGEALHGIVDEPLPVGSEVHPAPAAAGAPLSVPAAEEPLSLELAGAPEPAGPGLMRVPLTIRSGARSKNVVLTLALTLDETD